MVVIVVSVVMVVIVMVIMVTIMMVVMVTAMMAVMMAVVVVVMVVMVVLVQLLLQSVDLSLQEVSERAGVGAARVPRLEAVESLLQRLQSFARLFWREVTEL